MYYTIIICIKVLLKQMLRNYNDLYYINCSRHLTQKRYLPSFKQICNLLVSVLPCANNMTHKS